MHQTQTPSSYQQEEKHINLELKQFHPHSEKQEIKYSMYLEEIKGFQVNPPQIHETGGGGRDRNWRCGRSTPIRVHGGRSTNRMVHSGPFVELSKRTKNFGADLRRCGGAQPEAAVVRRRRRWRWS